MDLSEVYRQLGPDAFSELLKGVSISRLKTYQLYERVKTRTHLHKLNTENLRKAAPKLWQRLVDSDEDLATDIAQAVLICHIDMIKDVLNFLGVPHEEGFFAKDLKPEEYLKANWRERAFTGLSAKYPRAILLFYLNHLAWELSKAEDVYAPAA